MSYQNILTSLCIIMNDECNLVQNGEMFFECEGLKT